MNNTNAAAMLCYAPHLTQHPWQGEDIKEREKRRRLDEEAERSEVNAAQQSPYAALSANELKDLIFERTGRKTRKQNRQCLLDILTGIDNSS